MMYISIREDRTDGQIPYIMQNLQVQQERIQMAQATASCIKANEHYVSYT